MYKRQVIDGPFAVINADDYYGPEAFRVIYDYLTAHPDQDGLYAVSYTHLDVYKRQPCNSQWPATPWQ